VVRNVCNHLCKCGHIFV